MGAVEAELKRLGEFLGEDHDLFLLTEKGAMNILTFVSARSKRPAG